MKKNLELMSTHAQGRDQCLDKETNSRTHTHTHTHTCPARAAPHLRRGAKTVTPAHISGAAEMLSRASGMMYAKSAGARSTSWNPPWLPDAEGYMCGQTISIKEPSAIKATFRAKCQIITFRAKFRIVNSCTFYNEAAVALDAHVLVATQAGGAGTAAVGDPADAHALPHLQRLDALAYGFDVPNHLLRVLGCYGTIMHKSIIDA